MRVCDPCIQVIDEKIALSLNQRFGKTSNNWVPSHDVKDEDETNDPSSCYYVPPPKPERSGRAVISKGRYRAEIKESEGNRYIRDCDL
jgi:hypothetical protein